MSESVEWYDDGEECATINQHPNSCPLCHRVIEPNVVTGRFRDNRERLMVVYSCTGRECGRLFIAHYWGGNALRRKVWRLGKVEPCEPKPMEISDRVKQLSERYVKIREQVSVAEAAELDEIVGMGLRKALDFLVRDFAKHKRVEADYTEIAEGRLGAVIRKYITDPRMNACAKRAAWLGNDQTHYVVKWEKQDIEDLKRILEVTANWIDSDLATEEAVEAMPDE